MPHADAAALNSNIQTKPELWNHIYVQLEALLSGQRQWVSNLSNAASLIYSSLLEYPGFGSGGRSVNWCGFYIDSPFFPQPRNAQLTNVPSDRLLLGPFCGKPACQYIDYAPEKARGVCAAGYIQRETVLVPNVQNYPGHIACDGDTQSEIVCPLFADTDAGRVAIGVLDLDCLAPGGFDEDDKLGLERISGLISKACDW